MAATPEAEAATRAPAGRGSKGPACPRCHAALDSVEGPPGCARCGGVFLDRGDLEALAARRVDEPFRLHAPEAREIVDTAPFVSCPYCRALMERRVFAHHTGIVVDICAKHGIWFDGGELSRAVAAPPERAASAARTAASGVASPSTLPDASTRASFEVAVTNASLAELYQDRRNMRRDAWFASAFVLDLIRGFRDGT